MIPFDYADGFVPQTEPANLRLGAIEAIYEALFAEALADGVITPEERASLNQAAGTLGLDAQRLLALERALTEAYEARYRKRVREAERWALAPTLPTGIALTSSAMTAPNVSELRARVTALESKVASLELELAEARSHIPVDIDLSDMESGELRSDGPNWVWDRLHHDPRNPSLLTALRDMFRQKGDDVGARAADRALEFVQAAMSDHPVWPDSAGPLMRPRFSLQTSQWRQDVQHPELDSLLGEIFAEVAPAVLVGRVSALRREGRLPKLDAKMRQEPANSTIQAVRCVQWGAMVLGMQTPTIFLAPENDFAFQLIPSVPPAIVVGRRALSGRTPVELAFLAGRHLAYHRQELFLRLLLPSVPELEDVFLAALAVGGPALLDVAADSHPHRGQVRLLNSQVRERVAPVAMALKALLEPASVERLRFLFTRFMELGGRANVQRWGQFADRTAARAGFLLCDDLAVAHRMLSLDTPGVADEWMDDLLLFSLSENYRALRQHLGTV